MANILVIGGSRGMGRAIVDRLLAESHQVLMGCRQPELGPTHPQLQSFRWDAASEPFPVGHLPATLDGCVYCPGSITLKPFARLTDADFDRDWQINVRGAIHTIQAALPAMKNAERAAIVLFSSVAGQTGLPFHGSVAAAKAALEGLARTLAAEFAPAITVNVLAPALVDTSLAASLLSSDAKRQAIIDRNPLKRIGDPAMVAELACTLLTTAVPFMTGQVLAIDGGLSRLR